MARAARDRSGVASSVASVGGPEALEPFVVGAMLGSFGFHWRSDGPEHQPVPTIVVADTDSDEATETALRRAVAVGGAGWRARVLATVPANLKSPEWLAEQATELAGDTGLKVTVWDEPKLEKEGFGGILGVGRGSDQPSRLIRLDYTPKGATSKTPRVVLVGKGITFDSGGLSIKPADSMTTMKRDMTGGGVVMSVLGALAAVDCPVRVTGLIAAAENAVGADSMRPGDVLRHYGGRTSEVTNTDAEGRLVMADALAYAVDKLDPVAMVDVATLTGSMKVALGQQVGGYFANNEPLASAIFEAGEASGEPMWRFPLVRDYEEKLASKVADADNAAGGAGSITAALFLQHFTGDVPWAHMDIASVGDAPEESFEWTEGPTGFGARVLLSWLGPARPARGDRLMHAADRPLVPGRRARGRRGQARGVRRRDLPRPLHRQGGAALQDLADAPRGVVRGLLRLRLRRGARGVPGDLHRHRGGVAGLADHRLVADPHRAVRGGRGRRGWRTVPRR